MIKVEENYATEFIIFLCCGDIDHTRNGSEVEPLDGHISTAKKGIKILWRNSLPLLSQINITKPVNYPLANVGGDTFQPTLDGKSKCCLLVAKFFSASFYVFEMFDFWKADEKTISVTYRFAHFPFVVSFMRAIIQKLS